MGEYTSSGKPIAPSSLYTDGEHKVFIGEQGVINLGGLSWSNPTSTAGIWLGQVSGMKGPESSSDRNTGFLISNTYTPDTQTVIDSSMHEKAALRYKSGDNIYIAIRDSRYTTSTSFKSAMSGKYLFYQRTDDTSFIPPTVVDITEILLSATSYFDKQTGTLYKDWTAIWYDGTQTIPDNYISETGDLTPNQIVVYKLSTPTIETKTTTPVALTTKGNKNIVVQAEIPSYVKAQYLSKDTIAFINSKVEHDLDLVGSISATKTNNVLEVI